MSANRILLYLLRRDLRISDNPALHRLVSHPDHGFTHLLPLFVLPPDQIELSGFLKPGEKSPFPPARSKVGNFWRCGPHRANFLADALWDLKLNLEKRHSDLLVRLGPLPDVVTAIIEHAKSCHDTSVSAVWMTEDVPHEEKQQQEAVSAACKLANVVFELIRDEKYYIDDRDVAMHDKELPDVFTTYRKAQEPLREKPRSVLPDIQSGLPPFPPPSWIPPQQSPFQVPDDLEALQSCLSKPLVIDLPNPPAKPTDVESAHPFTGGETSAHKRLQHLIKSGAIASYADTRNGLLGTEFSTKLSAFLSFGCLTARQVHSEMVKYEDGTEAAYQDANGYGEGENGGTKAVRLELLWRDYMRLCTKKFGAKLFGPSGFRQSNGYARHWKTADGASAAADQDPSPQKIMEMIHRFCQGNTGMGLIDASQRELLATGYTSNRARQNVASFLSKHLDIDWRYGAEWYECLLVDYDTCSNWANWQYVAGVGNDPRGDARIFNPVKQAFDYDRQGDYVRAWIPEVRGFESVENVFQPWTASPDQLDKVDLAGDIMVTNPLKKIDFTIDRKPKSQRRPFPRGRGGGGGSAGGRGGRRGGGGGGGQGRGGMTTLGHMGGTSGGGGGVHGGMYGEARMVYDQHAYLWTEHSMGMGMGMGMMPMHHHHHHHHHPHHHPHHQFHHQSSLVQAPQQQWGGNSEAPVVSSGWATGAPRYGDYGVQDGRVRHGLQGYGHMHEGGGYGRQMAHGRGYMLN